jgi:hypothetical protein
LRRAAQTLRETSRGNLQDRLSRTGRQVANLEADQARVAEALEQLQQSALERARSGQGISRSDYGMQTFADVKRRMQEALAGLRGELTDLSDAVGQGQRDADAARVLDRALRELDETRVDERLAASAEAFEMGQPLYVIGSETLVQQALQRLGQRIGQAQRAVARGEGEESPNPLEEVRALRRRLADASRDRNMTEAEVAAVARSLDRLAPADLGSADLVSGDDRGQDGPGVSASRFARDRGVYTIRGTAADNTEALYRMTLERLDLIEAALESADTPPIRAQEPRDVSRDSAAAARYFRDLSRSTRDDD